MFFQSSKHDFWLICLNYSEKFALFVQIPYIAIIFYFVNDCIILTKMGII